MSGRAPGCVVLVQAADHGVPDAHEQFIECTDLILSGATATAVNAQLHAQAVPAPLVFVLLGEAMQFAPALTLGQRTAGRRIAGYCLVNPPTDVPAALVPSSDWPDAPVCVATLEHQAGGAARMARLHGWEFLAADSQDALTAAILQWSLDRRNDL